MIFTTTRPAAGLASDNTADPAAFTRRAEVRRRRELTAPSSLPGADHFPTGPLASVPASFTAQNAK